MTQLHHITLFFLFLSLSLSVTTTLPLTLGLSPHPPVLPPYRSPEPVPPKSTPSQPLTPQSINPIDNSTNTSNTNSYDCFREPPFAPFAPFRPLYDDCLSAISRIPEDPTRGLFQYVDNPHLQIPNLTPLTSIVRASLPTHSDFPASKISEPAA